MQKLQEHLSSINKIISSLTQDRDIESLEDAKTLKSTLFVVDRVLNVMEHEMSSIKLLKLRTMSRLSEKVQSVKADLQKIEAEFIDVYAAPASARPTADNVTTKPDTEPKTISVDIGGGIIFETALYRSVEDAPTLTYCAVMKDSRPLVIYKYSDQDVVSCTACQVTDYQTVGGYIDQSGFRTVCCGNSTMCEYGASCKYFHDPLLWPRSDHVQRFVRTNMVKKCPYFGHVSMFQDQIRSLNFDNVRTLARYCAVMNLLVTILSRANSKTQSRE